MSDAYLPTEEVVRLVDAALDAGLADPMVRKLLLDGILPRYKGTLPLLPGPGQQVHSDLNEMNRVERLIDGSVPLEIWLRNAVAQTTQAEPLAVFQRALDAVARDAAGEPDVPAGLPAGETKEEIIHRDDTVPFEFLRGGELAGTSVARIKVPPYQAGAPLQPNGFPHSGTGWLIAPGLLVTNHHVVTARTRSATERGTVDPADLQLQVQNSRSRFDYGADETETEEVTASGLVACDEQLDYAIMRLTDQLARPALRVAVEPLTVTREEPVAVNIIQHPGGQPKRVALRNNLVYEANDQDVRYFTDTRGGSSGSPVFTDDWRVVALHRGTRRVEDVNFQGKTTAFVNVGTQMSSVMRHLAEHSPEVYQEVTAAQSGLTDKNQTEVT
ncbi:MULTISPECIES: trypsin-like peptidase domain-containing protein [unclassified Streptomyces]|uniref:trypsin-like peptidase domain-containing protein n=1 Tax=unclassified Streptomyces TaxID=2593676 RepID=UPI001BE8F873|nr:MULTISPECIES: trypsin-like peptidase domain-containing protein [unclassified Streptomyces]MBT2406163.1 trypsin-like peptidase domain-containing protein [Streptomyces sp. ISL-21]MBT2459516.1 trypsin-like peptidase domain-containing protein [Streptomyces sp. ISL-86]MBT2609221.1 trypsin-like peptidase domain-containing protein [Streptomyces sp. ISL-87]